MTRPSAHYLPAQRSNRPPPRPSVQEERDEERENYHITERRMGKTTRTLRLPSDADEDSVRAQYEGGVLRVCIEKKPKHESSVKRVQITEGYPFAK
jgi:HSP20 family molecular chaperone IbpA